MLATIEDVARLTGYDVTLEHIALAQGLVETYVGRTEEQLSARDKVMASRAVCYQAAYVSKNYETIFEQVAVRAITQTDGTMVLDVEMASPYMAVPAMWALRQLSGRSSQSIKTGAMFGNYTVVPWERD